MKTTGELFANQIVFAEDGDLFIRCRFINCEVGVSGSVYFGSCEFRDSFTNQRTPSIVEMDHCWGSHSVPP